MIMKEYVTLWYPSYGPFKNHVPPVISCTLYDEETQKFGRGVAVCSADDKDNYDIDKGTKIAKNKAIRALKRRGDEYIKRDGAISILVTTYCPFVKSIDSSPVLTFQERKVFFGFKDIKRQLEETATPFYIGNQKLKHIRLLFQ